MYIYIYRSLSIRNLPSIPILRPGVTRTSTDFLFLRLTCVVEDLWIFSSDEDVVVYPPHSDIQNTNIIIVILCSMFVPYMLTVYVPCSMLKSTVTKSLGRHGVPVLKRRSNLGGPASRSGTSNSACPICPQNWNHNRLAQHPGNAVTKGHVFAHPL